MYYTNIGIIETYATINQKFTDTNTSTIWHDWLGYPNSIMMRRIIENSLGHSLKSQKILQFKEFSCATYSQEKLIMRHHQLKLGSNHLHFWNVIRAIYVGPLTHHVDHLDII